MTGEQRSNLDTVVAWFEATARGETPAELWDPDCTVTNAEGWIVDAEYRGREGMLRWWQELAEAASEFAVVPVSIEQLGPERFLTAQRATGRFRSTGIAVDLPWWAILTVRSGLIVAAVGYLSEGAARAAALGSGP